MVAPGSSILDAATAARVSLPYSCKTGRCSTCKCKVVTGQTVALRLESGLSDQEKADGWILSCVRTPAGDALIEADDLGGRELPVPKIWPSRISAIDPLAPDVLRISLRLPPSADFRFLPGQYIEVIGPNAVRRSYSLASACLTTRLLELHVRAVQGGALSDYWFNHARQNDLLRINGPLGTFFLRDTKGVNLVFLATGTGIAPIKAMLESVPALAADRQPKSVTLFWGGRRAQDLYLDVTSFPGEIHYIPVQSRPDRNWTGETGHIQDVWLTKTPDLTNAVVYACGSNAMIASARSRLVASGLPANRFYADAFVSSGPI